MNLIKKLISKYSGSLRSWKWVYTVYNYLNFRKLKHNQDVLEELGLDINVFRSVGTKDLPTTDAKPWVDSHSNIESLKQDSRYQRVSPRIQEQLLHYFEHGYIVLKKHYDANVIQAHNDRIDELKQDGKAYTNYGGTKMMDVHAQSEWIDREFFQEERVMTLLRIIFDKKVIPFQTIHFLKGSEQKAHSDSIHMSTYPPGYLAGVWTALEEIGLDQGPLFYYPGSHKWPYVSCEDYNSGNTKWRIGETSYSQYEQYMNSLIENSDLSKEVFVCEPGDVLIWHANLVHGGLPMQDASKTRRSMVGHYYADEVFCYHEISQRPSLIPTSSKAS